MSTKREPSRFSKFSSRSNYDPAKAMAKRKQHLIKVCQKYADVMTPSSFLNTYLPKKHSFMIQHLKKALQNVFLHSSLSLIGKMATFIYKLGY